MLGKLIKYEFRATQRTILPLLAASLVLAVLANFSMRSIGREHSVFVQVLTSALLMFFGLSIFACLLMSLVMMIQRFQRNLLTDEGYLMFTLPVSACRPDRGDRPVAAQPVYRAASRHSRNRRGDTAASAARQHLHVPALLRRDGHRLQLCPA